MSATLTPREVEDVTILDAVGRVTLGEGARALTNAIQNVADQGKKKVILNMALVSYIDSSGIMYMVSGFTTLMNKGASLKLLNLTPRVKDLLQITKLYTVFEVYDDEERAIQSFKK